MDLSVVIPTRDQEERLRLVLCALEGQTLTPDRFEVVVVDDGCSDGTPDMVMQIAANGPANVRLVANSSGSGRSAARNSGIAEAKGELVVFLDGDALPAPDLLETQWRAHQQHGPQSICCGMQWVLPELEYFQDPQTGTLMPGAPIPSVMKDFLAARRDQLVVTEEMVRGDFDVIRRRAYRASYPNEGTQRRQDEARQLLRSRPRSPVGWVGFIPHNGAVPRSLLRAAGGFDEEIPFSEGWELAYRLQRHCAARFVATDARTYHLYHHHRFDEVDGAREEAQVRHSAVEYMAQKHCDSRIRLLYFWFAHLWADPYIPEEAVVSDLFEFDRLYAELPEEAWDEYLLILAHHPSNFPVETTAGESAEVEYEYCA